MLINPAQEGFTALHYTRRADIAGMLLETGASPNIKNRVCHRAACCVLMVCASGSFSFRTAVRIFVTGWEHRPALRRQGRLRGGRA
jgi:hypothetical protein